MRKFSATILALALFAISLNASAQTRRNQSARPASSVATMPSALLTQLPASDAVMTVDVKRLLSELPRAYANDATELARVNAEIGKFAEHTGLDARQFERFALGVHYGKAGSGATTLETVALMHGAFNPATIFSAAQQASGGKAREEQYGGRSVHVFNFDEQVKLIGLFNMHLTELAVSALDANTLAVGKLSRVREAIDAAQGRGRVSIEIAALATRAPAALIGMGGNVPASATQNLDFLSPEFSRSIAAIRQFYGSVGSNTEGFQMLTVLRTTDAGSAKTLGESIESLKALAPFAIGQFARGKPERARLLRGVVNGMRVGAQGNELQISLDLAQNDLAALIQAF
ncbi:MAG: hypothetical protein QOE33_2015 [Acidobacteriota bacterium]|nr:hypothetical protein [Acidobacteriota bacterium]